MLWSICLLYYKHMAGIPQTLPIRDSIISEGTLVLVATDNTVWIMGRNSKKCLGVDTPESMTKPAMTDIMFDPEETIRSFHHHGQLVVIYTSQKRLFVSHVLKPSMFSNFPSSISDRQGLYTAPNPSYRDSAEPTERPSIHRRGLEQLSTLEWPEPHAAAFAMPYARRDAPLVPEPMTSPQVRP